MSPRPSPRLYPHPRTPPSPGSPIPSQRALRGAGKRPPGSGHRQQAPPRRRPSPLREAPPGLQPSPPPHPSTGRDPPEAGALPPSSGRAPRAPPGPAAPSPVGAAPSAPLAGPPPPRAERFRQGTAQLPLPPPQRPALGTGARPRGGAQGTLGDVVSRGGRGAAAMLGAGRLCAVSSAGAGRCRPAVGG